MTVSRRCPSCNAVYQWYTRSGTYLPKQYGSPFANCKACGKTFVMSDVSELALKPISYYKRRMKICTWCDILSVVIFIGLPAAAIIAYKLGYLKLRGAQTLVGWSAIAWFGALAVCHFIGKANHDNLHRKTLEDEYQASQNRLSDPAYANAILMLEERRKR